MQGSQKAAWGRDVRAALLLVLIARCSLDTAALQQAGGEGVFVDLLSDSDPRVRFHAATFLQQRLRTARPEVCSTFLEKVKSGFIAILPPFCSSDCTPCSLTHAAPFPFSAFNEAKVTKPGRNS